MPSELPESEHATLSLTSSLWLSVSLRQKLKDVLVSPTKSPQDPLHKLPSLTSPSTLPVPLLSNYTGLLDAAGRFQRLPYLQASAPALPPAWLLQALPPRTLSRFCPTSTFSVRPSHLTCSTFLLIYSITFNTLYNLLFFSFFFFKPTAATILRQSPIQVLTRPNPAQFPRSDI